MAVFANAILIMAAFLIQDITILESASASKRVIYQTFFGNNLLLTCYGTCSPFLNGYSIAIGDSRCEGNNVRLKCNRGYVIRVSFAFYGELEAGQDVCKDISSLFEQCRKDVSEIVGKECNGKEHCLMAVDGYRFGKFCQGQYFYLDIRHSCDPKPSTHENTEASTTTNKYTTNGLQTTEKTTKLRPITGYQGGTSNSPGTSTNKRDDTTQGSTNSQDSTAGTSVSHPSSSGTTTHAPISGAGGSTKGSTGQKVPKLVTSSPRQIGKSSGKKASLYWLLTAHSLVTDKGFIKANSTHLVLAIMLSIFIALVISICFLLDHSRRQARKRSRKQPREECGDADDTPPMENGSPVGYDLPQEPPPRPKSSASLPIANGNAKRLSTRSLDDFNHNTADGSEFFPLLPVVAQSLNSINRQSSKEISRVHSSLIDHLPPPPEELLLDSPRQDIAGYFNDNESEASTVSIPPPIGFADADIVNKSTPDIRAEFQIKSPSSGSNSAASNYRTLPNGYKSLRPKVENAQRLNNEFCSEISAVSHDSNLLHNSVSVQTNDLRDTSDKKSRSENAGHVSMRSPFLEVSDTYSTTDDISNIAAIDLQEFSLTEMCDVRKIYPKCATNEKFASERHIVSLIDRHMEENAIDLKNESLKTLARKNDSGQSAKRGKLIVIKSSKEKPGENESDYGKLDTSETKCDLIGKYNAPEKEKLLSEIAPVNLSHERNEKSRIKGVHANGSIGANWSSNRPLQESSVKTGLMDDHMASASSVDSDSSVLPRYDEASNQIFAVPKHRCGMGHTHKCFCIPLRTGSSSFICSCLENAKYKSSKCCVENCPEEIKSTGMPYSSQRSSNWRGLATDIPKRKTYNGGSIKRSSSLEHLDHIPSRFADAKKSHTDDDKGLIYTDKTDKRGRFSDGRANTLPHLQSKLKKANATSSGSKTLDRVHWASAPSARQDPKLIPVIVHSTRNKQVSRFEKGTDRLSDKVKSILHSDTFRSTRSDDSDSSDRSGSTEGRSMSLPTTPVEKRRKKNGHHRLSPISENAAKKPSTQEPKSWPKRSPRFRIQVVESVHYDKKKHVNEV